MTKSEKIKIREIERCETLTELYAVKISKSDSNSNEICAAWHYKEFDLQPEVNGQRLEYFM